MARRNWPRISQLTLADQVYETVRDRILDGDLQAGEFTREQALSSAMGVSRTPVREALSRLASEGFLERIPHRGFRVPDEPFSRLLELYPIVAALEVLAGRLAFPKLGSAALLELRKINHRMGEAVAKQDVRRELELNNEFHNYIAERSGNSRLRDLLADLRSQLTRLETWYYSYPERAEESIREHSKLIEALERKDIDRALAIFRENMQLTERALMEERGRPAGDRSTSIDDPVGLADRGRSARLGNR